MAKCKNSPVKRKVGIKSYFAVIPKPSPKRPQGVLSWRLRT